MSNPHLQRPSRLSRSPRTVAVVAAAALTGLLVPAAGATAQGAAPTGPGQRPGQERAVSYEPTDAVIANPQRGFYKHTETHYREDGSGYTPLDAETLRGYRTQGITQILRVVYLEKFVDQETLDPEWLALVEADLETAREAGVSVIVRFAYVQGGAWPYSPPHGDAPLETVLAHIDQLGPLLREHAPVIATVQTGFVGLWGEGYYTDHFVDDPSNPGVVSDDAWQDRAAVVTALLDELPEDRTVQLRTMAMKQEIFDVPTGVAGAVTPEQAFDGSDLARTGHHNDCFLASPDDFGTFLSDPLSLDQEYLAAETRYLPMGGETCTVNPPRSQWASASAEMARYHFSYLNLDYNRDVLASWGEEGMSETARQLGYRLVMRSSTVARGGARQGALSTVSVSVANEGWASAYNPRTARLVLVGDAGTWTVPFLDEDGAPADVRTWAPGETSTVTARACGVPAGRYAAYLDIPAPEGAMAGNPDYSVQTANDGTWVAETGWNDLDQQVSVSAASSTARACEGGAAEQLDR